MIKEILLVHHTHTDIGYTHPQPVVFELHDRFIEMALDLADASADDRDDAKFRWTCEVTGVTRAWWDCAAPIDRNRFLSAVNRGQIEVAALEWHLTPLADLRMLVKSLENVRFFRGLGVPIRSAMNTDVNGAPWGLVDVLLDHGIDGFSMSSNSHFGAPVTPRPGAFRWVSPDDRELLVWNGFQYWHFANVLLRLPSSVEEIANALPPLIAEADRRGYTLPYLPVQITNPHHPDNASPDTALSAFVRDWNNRDPSVRIRTVLLSEVFDRLRKEELPCLSGDWTDYWNFGAGSSARETTVYQVGLRVLDAGHAAASWPGEGERRELDHLDAAHAALALYAEHTWGADCSISAPDSIETHMQWAIKSAYAFEGLAHARIVLRDALHRLARRAGGEEPTLLLYNPLPFKVRLPMRLPVDQLAWALTAGVHHRQRLDGALANLPNDSFRWCEVDLPALGYRTYPVADIPAASSLGLEAGDGYLFSSRVQMEFAETGGVRSLRVDGIEYVGDLEGWTFGLPIIERPSGGSRREIMKLDFSLFEPAEGWQMDWKRDTTPGRLFESSYHTIEGAVECRQAFAMENKDQVEIVYRLFANDPTVDVEMTLTSFGDAAPYSLAVPFTLPEANHTQWHFDTAGALVEFEREQLPNAAQHFVTTRRFVRMQTEKASLSIATPDLPLWKFGGMFFAPTNQLNPADRQSVVLAWLANNYWEVNFLANQTGKTSYRLRLLPHPPEPIDQSSLRALSYSVPAHLHAFQAMGPVKQTSESLLRLEGEGVTLESITKDGEDILLTLLNLRSAPTSVTVYPKVANWDAAFRAALDGTVLDALPTSGDGGWRLDMSSRGLVAVRLLRIRNCPSLG